MLRQILWLKKIRKQPGTEGMGLTFGWSSGKASIATDRRDNTHKQGR